MSDVGVVVGVLVQIRPSLRFVDMGGGAAWVISRRCENGRYKWTARIHFDGGRRSTRSNDRAAWREERDAS